MGDGKVIPICLQVASLPQDQISVSEGVLMISQIMYLYKVIW